MVNGFDIKVMPLKLFLNLGGRLKYTYQLLNQQNQSVPFLSKIGLDWLC